MAINSEITLTCKVNIPGTMVELELLKLFLKAQEVFEQIKSE